MADLHQVIQFASVTDHGFIALGTVDAGVGTDFHVVTDANDPDLRHLDDARALLGRFRPIAEAVGSDHGIGMDDATVTHDATIADHHAGPKNTIRPHTGVIKNSHTMMQHGAAADRRTRADHTEGPDPHMVAQMCAFMNNRGGVNARLNFHRRRGKPREHLGKSEVGIFDHDQRLAFGVLASQAVLDQCRRCGVVFPSIRISLRADQCELS